MNPLTESEKIISFRATILGKSPDETKRSENAIHQLRQTAVQKIDALRKQFWTTPQLTMLDELKKIDVQQLPDLQHAVQRLQLIAELIPEFQRLAAHPLTRINLVNTIKRMIMLPPREAGAIKAAYLRKASYAKALPIVQKMVFMMHKEFPQIYNLEPDWFFEISKLKPRIN